MAARHTDFGNPDFHPEAWSPQKGAWTVLIAPVDNGAINLHQRIAKVPFPFTEVQEHIRLHEAHHVLLTPCEWERPPKAAISGDVIDPGKPKTIGPLALMVEEVYVDAYAYHGDIDVNRRHDLCKAGHAQPTSAQSAVEWYLQFTPTAVDRDELADQRILVVDADASPSVIANWDRALTAMQDNGVDVAAVDEIIADLWGDPTPAMRISAIERLEALLARPEVSGAPEPGAGSPSSGAQEPSSDPATGGQSGQPGQSFTEAVEKALGQERIDNRPRDCGSRVEIEVMVIDANGTETKDEQRSGHATAVKGENDRAEALRLAMQMQKEWQAAEAKRDEAARDRQILTRARPKLAKDVTKVTKRFTIERVVLPANKAYFAAAPNGASQKGEELRQITRWWGDKAIFRSRRPGGTLILDHSGSMHWDYPTLREAIQSLPATTIAAYCGTTHDYELSHSERASRVGKMVIMAEKGRWCDPQMVSSQAGFSQYNAIDIEALQWLAKQPGPRVWLGDDELHSGLVNVLTTQHGPKYTGDHIRAICRNARIVRTRSVAAAVEYLKTGRMVPGIFAWNSQQFLGTSPRGEVQ